MRIQVLGSGTSTGVPEIGCQCAVCSSSDLKDRRLRSSILVCAKGKKILIDCGPDFRMQMLQSGNNVLDGVLLTHEHYDHVGGIDDLRPFCALGPVSIFAEERVVTDLKKRMPYCFSETPYPGVPSLTLCQIQEQPFFVQGLEIIPIRVYHHKLPILGYRIDDFAYITDMLEMDQREKKKLQNLKVLIVNALRPQYHVSHQTVAQAIELIRELKPESAYFIHMSHHFGLHQAISETLPENVFLTYDGLEITL